MRRAILAILVFITFVSATQAADIMGVVVQGNGDKAQFERALKLASNMREVLNHTRFEVVIFGSTVRLLTVFGDEAPLIEKVQEDGVKIIACGRSLKTDNVKVEDLVPGISVVPFGAVYIVERQQQGWQYFKP
ncbi:MAG: DsrE family protein [Sulfuricaulis sp.]